MRRGREDGNWSTSLSGEVDRYLRGVARQEQERLNRERRRLARPWLSRLSWLALCIALLLLGYAAYLLVDALTAGAVPAGWAP